VVRFAGTRFAAVRAVLAAERLIRFPVPRERTVVVGNSVRPELAHLDRAALLIGQWRSPAGAGLALPMLQRRCGRA
jgi:hypothetical protein